MSEFITKIAKQLKEYYPTEPQDAAPVVPKSAPPVKETIEAHKALIELLLPARRLKRCHTASAFLEEIPSELERIYSLLHNPMKQALPYRWISRAEQTRSQHVAKELNEDELEKLTQETLQRFFERLPDVRAAVIKDIQAAYDGDPAALSYIEVTLSFPGVLAVTSHRIVHELYKLEVPVLPRLMSEWTHSKTGVDIHPGAQIKDSFFIDHATGVVIGETARIGANVKLYQGVTLGAKSFALDEEGNPVKHIQRHPTVENNVVIYSNATILGGDTVIGANSIIGGNVFLTKSVPEDSIVYRSEEGPNVKSKN